MTHEMDLDVFAEDPLPQGYGMSQGGDTYNSRTSLGVECHDIIELRGHPAHYSTVP